MSNRVVVVGAGVVGLTCAVRLAEAGVSTDVIAADLPAETASALAGAVWLPDVSTADRRRWAARTLAQYLTEADTGVGVTLREGSVLGTVPGLPAWAGLLDGDRTWARADPSSGAPAGVRARVPVVDPPAYLRHLTRRLEAAGGSVTRMALPALPGNGTVVNATGARARWLADDGSVTPVRGHVVLVRNPGIEDFRLRDDDRGYAYVIPRNDETVVVGGTREAGELLPTPDPATADAVLAAATRLDPRLRGAEVLGARVGLRPGRPTVRVDLEVTERRRLVHCYGHGGDGWALAWGTADEVLGLLGQGALF